MRHLFFMFTIFLSTFTFSQLEGEIADSGRKLLQDFDFSIVGHKQGKFVFNIGVDMDGRIKACEYDATFSTIVSTPLMVKAKNHILTNLKLERGYHYPELHIGRVTITVKLESSVK